MVAINLVFSEWLAFSSRYKSELRAYLAALPDKPQKFIELELPRFQTRMVSHRHPFPDYLSQHQFSSLFQCKILELVHLQFNFKSAFLVSAGQCRGPFQPIVKDVSRQNIHLKCGQGTTFPDSIQSPVSL
jgi:hypothetical protein